MNSRYGWFVAIGIAVLIGWAPACGGCDSGEGGEDGVVIGEDGGDDPLDGSAEEETGTDEDGTTAGDAVRPPEDTDETIADGDSTEGDADTRMEVPCEAQDLPELTATSIVSSGSFSSPLYLTQAPGESETLLVVERGGTIQRVEGGEILETPFLDVGDRITAGGEQGLLGLAFHPDYENNGRFFVFYTAAGDGANVVAEYARSTENSDVAESEEVRRLVEKPDTEGNHNGGMIAFGSDGHLYVAMGDGGGAGDRGGQHAENGNGQTPTNIFGAILRLDVDASGNNFAADGNPFVGSEEGDDRIWAYGLRNPWRFSFDRQTGDLWIGDVGQNAYEEINFEAASNDGGENYGWRGYEGKHVFDQEVADLIDDHYEPVIEIEQQSNEEKVRGARSITGGYVYRGEAISELRGYYLYGDYVSNEIAALRYCEGEIVDHVRLPGLNSLDASGLSSFGEDNEGNLYLNYLSSGDVMKIEAQ